MNGFVKSLLATTAVVAFATEGYTQWTSTKQKKAECINGVHDVRVDMNKINNSGIFLPVGASFEILREKEHGGISYGPSAGGSDDPIRGITGPKNLFLSGYSIDPNLGHGATLIEFRSQADVGNGELLGRDAVANVLNDKKDIKNKAGIIFFRANDKEIGNNTGYQIFEIKVSGCPTPKNE